MPPGNDADNVKVLPVHTVDELPVIIAEGNGLTVMGSDAEKVPQVLETE